MSGTEASPTAGGTSHGNDGHEAPTESLEKLHLDEVTGEKVSKSELKKRIKNREREEKARVKATQNPVNPTKAEKTASAEDLESDLNPNVSAV